MKLNEDLMLLLNPKAVAKNLFIYERSKQGENVRISPQRLHSTHM